MLIRAGQRYTDVIQVGYLLTIAPSGSLSARILITNGQQVQILEQITFSRTYGPFLCDMILEAYVLSGEAEITAARSGATALLEGWDDLRFPAQAINPAGATDAPSVDTTLSGFPGTLLFSGSQENVICGIAQVPHAWKRDSALRPHIHWTKPTGSSSAVSWVFYYRHCGMAGEAPDAWVGPVAGVLAAGDQSVSDQHLISSFGAISMAGKKESSCLNWQIRRLGNTDADNNAVRLLEFDIHYEVSKGGTTAEIPS